MNLRWVATAAMVFFFGINVAVPQSSQFPLVGQRYHSVALEQSNNEDWKIHSNWCANVDNGSSHRVYLQYCHRGEHDQYDSVLACQRDAGQNNGDGGSAVRAVENAGRPAVNAYMADKHPPECDPR